MKQLLRLLLFMIIFQGQSSLYGQCVPGTNAAMNIIGGTSTCEGVPVHVQNNVMDDGAVHSYLWRWNADNVIGYPYDTTRLYSNINTSYTYNFPDSIIDCNTSFLELEIELEVFDTCGTYPNRNSSPIIVYVKPRTSFFATSPVCEGEVVAFINSTCPSTSDITYHWDFGDPSTTLDVSTQANPSYTYPSSGTYTVTLTATNTAASNSCGVLDSVKTFDVVVLDSPEPLYTLFSSSLNATQDTMCLGSLSVTSTSNHTDSINIDVFPSGGYTITPNDYSIPTNINFTQPGDYSITITAYQCSTITPCNSYICESDTTFTIHVLPSSSASLNVPSCVGNFIIDFNAPMFQYAGNPPSGVVWHFFDIMGNTTHPNYNGISPPGIDYTALGFGTYIVEIIYPDACNNQVLRDTFTIGEPITLDTIPDFCLGATDTIDLDALILTPANGDLDWTGNGVFIGADGEEYLDISALGSNTHFVFYTDPLGCNSSGGSISFNILNGATVSLNSFSSCYTSPTIDFDNITSFGGSQADSVRWNIWEQPNNNSFFTFLGIPPTLSPGVVSISAGDYIVEVIVYSECGSDTASRNLFVPDVLVMDTIPDFCLGDTSAMILDNLVLSPQGLDLMFSGTGVANDTLYIGNISTHGLKTITYSDPTGCYLGTIDFEIFNNPIVALSTFPPCHTDSVFNVNTYVTYSGAPYDSVFWTVTNVAVSPPTVVTYDTAYPGNIPVQEGKYAVVVNVYGECGVATAVDTIYVPEVLNLLPIGYQCSNVDTCINLNDLIISPQNLCLNWSGAGVTGSCFNPSQANFGNNTISYIGCTDPCYSGSITINVIDATSTLPSLTVCVSDDGIALDPIQAGRWSGTGVVADTFYPNIAGSDTFDLVYRSDTNAPCFIQDTLQIIVTPSVTATVFVNSPNCVDSTFTFINTSGEMVMSWSFTNSTADLVTNTYAVAGTYTEYLVVGNAACRDTLYFDVIVEPYITTTFSIIDTTIECEGITVTLNIDNPHPSYNYLWQVDGNTDTSAQPTFFVQGATVDIFKNINLTISNTCETIQLQDSVFVPAIFNASFGALQTDTICHGDSISFANISTGYIESYTVDYDNDTTSTNSFITQAYFNLDDTIKHYRIMLVIFSNQCQYDTAYQDIYVIPSQIEAAMSISDFGGCEPHPVSFICYSTPGTVSTIFMGDANNSRITGIQPEDTIHFTYLNAGTYYPYMIAYGCGIDTFYLNPVTIDARPELGMFIPPYACQGEEVLLKDTSGNTVGNIAWYIDGALVNATGGDFSYAFETAGTYQVTMTGTHIFTGCKDTISQNIFIEAVPDGFDGLEVSPVIGCLDEDGKLLVNVKMTAPYDSMFINFGNNQSSTQPDSIYYQAVGEYDMKIRLITSTGCVIDTLINITILPTLQVHAYPVDTSIRLGEAIEIYYESNDNGNHTWYYQSVMGDSILNEGQRFWTIPKSISAYNQYIVQLQGNYPTCVAWDTAIVRTNRKGQIEVAEIFSPNGDNLNDKLTVLTNGEIEEVLELIISTKQGTHIYEERNFLPTPQVNAATPIHGWDGTLDGEPMPVGVYVWKARVRFIDGTVGYAIGNVSLIR